jgi:hypothetical protein
LVQWYISSNRKPTAFRVIIVKPYYRNKHTIIPAPIPVTEGNNKGDAYDKDYFPEPEIPQLRRHGRPRGLKNKPKDAPAMANMTQKETNDARLAVKLRKEGKTITSGKPFEEFQCIEIEELIGKGVFRIKPYNSAKHGKIRIFKLRIINEIKGKATDYSYEKSRHGNPGLLG